jgi:hypothetical protein
MGATRVIAVNVLPWMPSAPLRAVLRVFRVLERRPDMLGGVELSQLAPRVPLGSIRDAMSWNPENLCRWIQQGEDDALQFSFSPLLQPPQRT